MNTTTLTTVLGIIQAIGVSSADYLVHMDMSGGVLTQPTFWIGLVIAAAMGLKGYYTQGTPSAPVAAPAVAPSPQV